jgi:hypothetical protein
MPKDKPEEDEQDETPQAPEAPKPPDGQPPKPPSKVASLRQAYESTKRRVAELELEVNSLKTAKPPEDPEKKTLSERLAEREKRLGELEDRIRFSAYEQSDEYREKYEKPFVAAYQSGRAKAASMKTSADDGTERQGQASDFDRIMQIADDNAAADAAFELFGNKASSVMYWRERVLELNGARTNALEEYRKTATEKHKQEVEHHTQSQSKMASLYEHANKSAIEKYPQFFKPTDGDAEGNKLLEAGYRRADMAFNGGKGVDENGKEVQLSPEAMVFLHSELRNKAAGFNRQVYLNKKLTAKIAELEKSLAEFKTSEPGSGEGGKGKEKPKYASLMDEVEAGMDKFAGR